MIFATCTSAKTCSRCGKTEGSALGHNWNEATCTSAKVCSRCNKAEGDAIGHKYTATVTPATCTTTGYTTYTCSCGDSYVSDYTESAHTYSNHICTICGKADEHYQAYQNEYDNLTAEYNADIAEMRAEIDECNNSIDTAQQTINNARGELVGLSPACPQWYLQQYVNNWQIYGSTSAATQAANAAWAQEYNSRKAQLESTINYKTAEIQTLQNRVSTLNTAIDNRTDQYNINIQALKTQHGII